MVPRARLLYILALGLALGVAGGCATLPDAGPGSLAALRAHVQDLEARLRAAEAEKAQTAGILQRARGAIAYVRATYTFVDAEGRPLRHVLNDVGQPVADPKGVPLVDVTGTGSVAVVNYCGTAFLVGREGELLTNRHIAQPWWGDQASAPLLAAGLRPVFLLLRAFFQERDEAVPVEVLRVDATLDIALVRTVGWAPSAEPLPLYPESDPLEDGHPVILMGYPTGLEAMLAKLETAERVALEAGGGYNYATVEYLARTHQLRPSITGGFLWEVLSNTLVYDARTTGGGSGGPLLDRHGRVIGVNEAYLPDFQGGNYAVPIRFGQALLKGGGIVAAGPTQETPEGFATMPAPDDRPIAREEAYPPLKGNGR
jgi:S1-C subfamily serine protease